MQHGETLTDDQHVRLQQIVQEYTSGWQNSPLSEVPHRIHALLPTRDDPVYLWAVPELLATDFRLRARDGEMVRVEQYLEVLEGTDLHHLADLVPRLMGAEFRQRQESGEQVELAEFHSRFPQVFDRFHELLVEAFQQDDVASGKAPVSQENSGTLPSGSERTVPISSGPERLDSPQNGPAEQDLSSRSLPTDPAPSDPAPSDPAPTDPAPTDPAPSDAPPSDAPPSDRLPADSLPGDSARDAFGGGVSVGSSSDREAGEVRDSESPNVTASGADVRGSNRLQVGEGYKLLEMIGRGGYGEVWRAEAPGGVLVAVKIITTPTGHALSQSEQRALDIVKQLTHPFLVKVQAHWVHDDRLVIAMELADCSLEDRHKACLAEGLAGIPPEELIRYMQEAAEAIDLLHSQQRVHRDIKPANILLAGGHAKLGDFGLARLFEKEELDVKATFGGTANYMPPEMWWSRAGPRSDQYSLAVTYAELRLGKPLFEGQSVPQLMNQHLNSNPVLAELASGERKVISRALSKKPERRYETCSEFTDALAIAVLKVDTAPSPYPRRYVVISLLVAALLVVLAFIAVRFVPAAPELRAPGVVDVAAGESAEVVLYFDHLSGSDLDSSIVMSHENIPELLTIHPSKWSHPASSHSLRLSADLAVPPGEHTIQLRAKLGQRLLERPLIIRVAAATVCCPAGFRPTEDAQMQAIAAERRIYWTRVISEPHGMVFRLIEPNSEAGTSSFYISENMITNALFTAFDAAKQASGEPLANRDWEQGVLLSETRADGATRQLLAKESPQHPVFHVTADDAFAFSRWVHPFGHLPTTSQWDVAAGRYGRADTEGPYRWEWEPGNSDSIGVGRSGLGPLPAGAATHDVSLYGCRDMAGNGLEWTSTVTNGQRVPLQNPDAFVGIVLRSESFRGEQPLQFEQIEDLPEVYNFHQDDIGFRVVVEIDDSSALSCRADW